MEPPHVVRVPVHERSSAADVLRAALSSATLRIVESDSVIRSGGDVEGVHQARVACRRLRSDLRTFAPLLEAGWADPIREELRWLGSELGEVRDRDVLRARLEEQIATLPAGDLDAARRVLGRLTSEREEAMARAIGALDSPRYPGLLDRLVAASADPPVTTAARSPAADVLPRFARSAHERLHKQVRRVPRHPSDDALHVLRIRAKRARYAADVAVPVVGRPAARYTKAMSRLQETLGDIHDGVVAVEWLHAVAATSDGPIAFVCGELAEKQRTASDELRRRWHPAWVAARARTGWMG